MNDKTTSGFNTALQSWKELLGNNFVQVLRDEIKNYEQTTFQTTQTISAIIQPKNTEEVSACVKIASNHKVPIYPISRGRNWGLGSFVPPQSGCTIIDMRRMNRIIEFNEDLGYITVEPGVTFAQVAEFLKKKKSKRYLSVIGGPSDASLIGNMVERGDSTGPYGDRLQHACNMEVVLPTGDIINTGFGSYGTSTISNLHRNGVGPSFSGIFTQSNFGVVTRATFWLPLKPAEFQVVVFTLRSDEELANTHEAIKNLIDENVISPYSAVIWNRHKFLAWETQYPWDLTGEKTPLPSSTFDKISGPFRGIKWIGLVGIYAASKAHAKADRGHIQKMIKPHTKHYITITKTKARLFSLLKKPLYWITKKDIGSVVETLFNESIFLGNPTQKSVRGTYWRKRFPIPDKPNPERDKCGVIWMCPAIPSTSKDLIASIEITRTYLEKHGFEPIIAMTYPSSRTIYFLPALVYDREQEGEDSRALLCHDEMLQAFIQKKYFPHRLGIQSMDCLPIPNDELPKFWKEIKQTIDPSGIMAPKRYKMENT